MIDNEYHDQVKRKLRHKTKNQISDEKALHMYERPHGHHTIAATKGKKLG